VGRKRRGQVGGRFIILGDDAILALVALLEDSSVVDWYAGSEDATVGNSHKYRIKDFAAFHLGRILGKPCRSRGARFARSRRLHNRR
jgi:hypothetical protein